MKPYRTIRYPRPLTSRKTIAITAPSSGVGAENQGRLDLVIAQHRADGYEIIEGQCLRKSVKTVSAPASERARELNVFWSDPRVGAIIPPWGGELLIEILPRLDFEALAESESPPWLLGFSDISTLLFATTVTTGIATAHGANLMELINGQSYGIRETAQRLLSMKAGESLTQDSFPNYQVQWRPFSGETVAAPFNCTEDVRWKALRGENSLELKGRLIGGCIDVLTHLIGTPYGDLALFKKMAGSDGVILYLENCEFLPATLTRALWQMRLAGWYDGINGLVFGRSTAPDAEKPEQLSYLDAIHSAVGDLPFPVLYDADIGHRPPQMFIVNGALGELAYENGKARLLQRLQ